MSSSFLLISYLLPTSILFAGTIDDIKTQKVHNWLFLTCLIVAIVVVFITSGLQGLMLGGLGALCAIACFLPFVAMNVFGAGDLKLMIAFGMASDWNTVFWVSILSTFWGAAFGIVKIVISRGFFNIFRKLRGKSVEKRDRSMDLKIPYTVALLLGWFTYASYGALV